MENYFEIGKIVGTHGLRGTFKVFPTTQDPSRFEKLKEITIEHNNKLEVVHIQKVAYHKKFLLITVKEITDINVAELYKQNRMLIPDSMALPLEDDEYYMRDLYGINVFDENDNLIGEIVDIFETGSNDVYAVKRGEGEKDLLLPAIKDCILKVNIKERKMTVKILEGLLDL